jgi:hypothetical protein
MARANKVTALNEAVLRVRPGTLMLGEFVGASESAKCIEWLLEPARTWQVGKLARAVGIPEAKA